jgi:carbonic anhydrase
MVRLLMSGLLLVLSTGAVFAGAATVHWTYEGEEGPEHWGELSPDFTLCKDGVNQSPIDLVADLHAELPELLFQYHGTPIREINNGHTIQLNVSPGNFLEVQRRRCGMS